MNTTSSTTTPTNYSTICSAMTTKQTPESGVLEALGEYLSYRGHCFWRTNNTPIFDPREGRMMFRRMPRYSQKGVSDFIALKAGQAYFIEAKAPKGVLSPSQKEFKAKVEKAGSVYLVAHGIQDLVSYGF